MARLAIIRTWPDGGRLVRPLDLASSVALVGPLAKATKHAPPDPRKHLKYDAFFLALFDESNPVAYIIIETAGPDGEKDWSPVGVDGEERGMLRKRDLLKMLDTLDPYPWPATVRGIRPENRAEAENCLNDVEEYRRENPTPESLAAPGGLLAKDGTPKGAFTVDSFLFTALGIAPPWLGHDLEAFEAWWTELNGPVWTVDF